MQTLTTLEAHVSGNSLQLCKSKELMRKALETIKPKRYEGQPGLVSCVSVYVFLSITLNDKIKVSNVEENIFHNTFYNYYG